MELELDNVRKCSLLRTMLRIRKLQLAIETEYHLDEMKTPVHLYIGQEAIAAGVCAALRKDDYISSNHRSHGHYLAKGGDLKALVAELFCRITGCSKGRGGSMHLVSADVGHLGSSSIVGGGIPLGTGQALAAKMTGQERVSVIFFGDGAHDEGVLYESINFAILKKLPAIFVLENNQFSVCSNWKQRWGSGSPFLHYKNELLSPAEVDGNDVIQVYQTAHSAVARARRAEGPSFIACTTYRMRGHAGTKHDAHLGYRSLEEIQSWEKKDPILRFEQLLLKENVITRKEIDELEFELEAEIQEAFSFAKSSPLPEPTDLNQFLFLE